MSDLISRKAVKDGIREYFTKQISSKEAPWDILAHNAELQKMVNELPTVYDTNKVLKQIADRRKYYYLNDDVYDGVAIDALDEVADIIEKGGIE